MTKVIKDTVFGKERLSKVSTNALKVNRARFGMPKQRLWMKTNRFRVMLTVHATTGR
ncbi:MAG: hypothetical protein GWN96_06015 [candidate division Zixibacteria bacterium]|nr:hypothetical protein [candidate division Zixibacteria bacterium]